MAGTPVFLVENLFSEVQFPDHVVSGSEEPTGTEAWRVATGRRSAGDRWTVTTTNTAAWVKVSCNRMRAADMIVVDRGHNLGGFTFGLEVSADDFTTSGYPNSSTFETIFEITMPSASAPGDIDDGLGVLTEEGAWAKRFDLRAGTHWRFYVTAQSTLTPIVVGLWVGKSYNSRSFDFPWSEEDNQALSSLSVSESGWEGSGFVTVQRSGTIGLRMQNLLDYDEARYHIQGHFARRRPMWMVADQTQADRAILVQRAGQLGFSDDGRWPYRRGSIQWAEHEPERE